MIERTLTNYLKKAATMFPVVTLTGARQCGKSTLLKSIFPDYRYISLEDLDIRNLAITDPRGFLSNFGEKLIIDEAQYAPELFSYIQTKVDTAGKEGMYILSGSQNFLLMEKITQSLAGRAAVVKLPTFSVRELKEAGVVLPDNNTYMLTGFYPRIYDKNIPANLYYQNYVTTYLGRDVRTLRNIGNLTAFTNFIKLCAARVGQVLNLTTLADDADISIPTAKSWLSILEASYVIYYLRPYYKNFSKRLIKSPKLYFYDTGLASYLMGIHSADELSTHYNRGAIFENMVVSEFVKKYLNQGVDPEIWYWRENNGCEIDLLTGDGATFRAYEIKSAETLNTRFYKNLDNFCKISGLERDKTAVIYGGDVEFKTETGTYIPWKNIAALP